MPRVFLAVQLSEDVHRPVARMDVEHSVHVGAPIDGVPAQNTQRNRCVNSRALTGGGGSILGPVALVEHLRCEPEWKKKWCFLVRKYSEQVTVESSLSHYKRLQNLRYDLPSDGSPTLL